uniref:Uncharacterized protein ycf23 n=1 Tax=Porphyridium purpureum TaxID=35688 RepID=W0RZ95_PORPP|nr:conserved hypothetical plastid protein [Porphyridium purpureum]BAO23772.1 conserved hypothetical plastid protein [Porphyridium purpureum]
MINNLKILNAVQEKCVFKAISGIENFNIDSVLKLTHSAQIANATYVDICADPKIIRFVKSIYNIPICVSITNLNNIDSIINAGANLVELGNFDHLYEQGFYISDEEISNMVKTIRLYHPDIFLCVTIPHTLNIEQQINLAKKLENLNVDLIQTEGKSVPKYSKNLVLNISNAFASLTSAYAISQVVKIPVIAASNISEITSSIAVSYGASGVGVGKCIMKYDEVDKMVTKINLLKEGLYSDCNNIKKVTHILMSDILKKHHSI